MKILFIDFVNIDSSPTAEEVIRQNYPDIETRSAATSRSGRTRLNKELIMWADVILCMENYHKAEIKKAFESIIAGKTIGILNIKDTYNYMDPELVEQIKEKFAAWLNEYKTSKSQ
ncbi:MAG: hypothetical protein LBH04_02635 [Tannerellaceae bacterium]|jgi:predicted protein tyrosine phosphatase|nr:hypothetical protein [Tannerellaceae bacterium]